MIKGLSNLQNPIFLHMPRFILQNKKTLYKAGIQLMNFSLKWTGKLLIVTNKLNFCKKLYDC